MISFNDIKKLFSHDLAGRFCIEVEFLIREDPKYQSCWMGKMPDREHKEKEIYWYGLVPEGTEAYSYSDFRDFSSAPVFNGKSLKEIWASVEVLSIDGCDPEERLFVYDIP